jgi:glycerophosphoryl diester phosphodiesterase
MIDEIETMLMPSGNCMKRGTKNFMANTTQRIAHRGGSLLAPENTLAAFRNALTLATDAIELDVQMSRDGQLIVFHDNTLERLTDEQGNILDSDFDYLRSLNVAAHFKGGWPVAQQIPTLREVLELARGRKQVYIEIKTSKRDGVEGRYPNIAKAVVKEVQALAMVKQIVVISFDWPMLLAVKSLEPLIQTGAIVSEEAWTAEGGQALEALLDHMKTFACSWISFDYRLFTAEMPAIVHKRGLKLNLWTVNTLEDMRRFSEAQVDSLTSDRPDLFSQLQE